MTNYQQLCWKSTNPLNTTTSSTSEGPKMKSKILKVQIKISDSERLMWKNVNSIHISYLFWYAFGLAKNVCQEICLHIRVNSLQHFDQFLLFWRCFWLFLSLFGLRVVVFFKHAFVFADQVVELVIFLIWIVFVCRFWPSSYTNSLSFVVVLHSQFNCLAVFAVYFILFHLLNFKTTINTNHLIKYTQHRLFPKSKTEFLLFLTSAWKQPLCWFLFFPCTSCIL